MSLRKRLFSAALIILMAAGALYVGKSGMMISDSTAESIFRHKESIYFWYTDETLTDYLNSAAVAFNETKEDIRVVPVLASANDYLEAINEASLEGKSVPDVYLLSHDSLEKAYLSGLATQVKDYDNVCNTDSFNQVALDAVTYHDKIVAYPFYYETSVLLYNKTYLKEHATRQLEEEAQATAEEAGEVTDTEAAAADETVSEEAENEKAAEIAERVNQMLPETMDDILTFGNEYDAPEHVEAIFKWDVADVFYNYFFIGKHMILGGDTGDSSSNIDIYNLDTMKCLQVFQNLNEFFSIDASEVSYHEVVQDFLNGKIVYTVVTSDILKTLENAVIADEGEESFAYEYGFAEVPNPSAELQGRALSMTSGVAINGYSRNIKEANEFAKFLTCDFTKDLYDRTGKLTAHKTEYTEGSGFAVFAQAYEQSIPMPKMVEVSNFWMQLEIAMRDIWEGSDINSSLKALSEQIMTQVTGQPYTEEYIHLEVEEEPEYTDGEIIEEDTVTGN